MKKKEAELLAQRLMSRVEKRDDGCWVWTGATCYVGKGSKYGFMVIKYVRHNVRRLAYLVFGNKPALGRHTVDSSCKNSLCINPSHLVRSSRLKSDGPTARKK